MTTTTTALQALINYCQLLVDDGVFDPKLLADARAAMSAPAAQDAPSEPSMYKTIAKGVDQHVLVDERNGVFDGSRVNEDCEWAYKRGWKDALAARASQPAQVAAQDAPSDLFGDCVASECAARASQPATPEAATVPTQAAIAAAIRKECEGDAVEFTGSARVVTVDEAVRVAQLFATPAAHPVAGQAGDDRIKEARLLRDVMQRQVHGDRPGGSVWETSSIPERGLMLKAWCAAKASNAAPTAPQASALVPLTDAVVDAAIRAWFSYERGGQDDHPKRMRAALTAALTGITPTTKEQQ